MGNSQSLVRGCNISRVDVCNSAGSEEQSVVYTTTESRSCIFRVRAEVDCATISLRDYTFEREETGVDIKIRGLKSSSIGVNAFIQGTYWGNNASMLTGEEPCVSFIKYGNNAFLGLQTKNDDSHKLSNHLLVKHIHPNRRGFAVVVVLVWYSVARGRFCCSSTGPSWCSSASEAREAITKSLDSLHFAHCTTSTTNQTAITTGLINNIQGEVHGDLNGSVVYRPILNFIKIVNIQGDTLPKSP